MYASQLLDVLILKSYTYVIQKEINLNAYQLHNAIGESVDIVTNFDNLPIYGHTVFGKIYLVKRLI